MKRRSLLFRAGLGLILSMLVAGALYANEITCGDCAVRISGGVYGFPLISADLKIEGAVGYGAFTLSAWGELPSSLSTEVYLGGELRTSQSWLSLGVAADWEAADPVLTAFAQASLPAWLLVEGSGTLFAGADLNAQMEFFEKPIQRLGLSPYLAGVLTPGALTVRPSVGAEIRIDSATAAPEIASTHLASSLDLGNVLLSSNVLFEGCFADFRSLDLSVALPDLGLQTTVSMIAGGGGGFLYRIELSFEWGDVTRLRKEASGTGQICAGDVCF